MRVHIFCVLLLLVTLSEPLHGSSVAPVKLEDIYSQADEVAVVRILSGDSEHYEITVYKAVVEKAYKGLSDKQIIYLGPFSGYGIDNEYLVFLKRGGLQNPTVKQQVSYGPLQSVSTIMYAGYAMLPIGYECVFDGKDVVDRCAESVQFNPSQIIVPDTIRTFPEGEATSVTNYKKWARKEIFLGMMSELAK